TARPGKPGRDPQTGRGGPMMRSSRTDALDLMRAANPVSAAGLRTAIDEDDLVRAMQRAIAVGESPVRPIPAGDRIALERGAGAGGGRGGIFLRHRAATVAFGLACAA